MAGNSIAKDIALVNLILTPLETGEVKPAVIIDRAFDQFQPYVQHGLIQGWVDALIQYQELLYSGEVPNTLVMETVEIHGER